MSKLYDNIRSVCKQNGLNLGDFEKPRTAGFISRYERRGAIMELPIGLIYIIAKECHVTVENLIEDDISLEAEIAKVRAEIARLEAMEKELQERKEKSDD